jgi:hypothetical protein
VISVFIDSTDSFMAKSVNTQQAFGWRRQAFLLMVFGILVTVSGWQLNDKFTSIDHRFTSIDTTLIGINSSLKAQGELLARLNERTKPLEHRKQASGAGFKDEAQIITASLKPKAQFVSADTNKGSYDIRYTVMDHDPMTKIVTVRMEGRIGPLIIKNHTLAFKAEPGISQEIFTPFDSHGFQIPKVFFHIIDLTTEDNVVLVIGPKLQGKSTSDG